MFFNRLNGKCRYKYLDGHEGIVYFSAGTIVKENMRNVNVQDRDANLHVVFKNKVFHDACQNADSHREFIEEDKHNWKTVRVFDSFIKN